MDQLGQAAGQAQAKKDETMNKASEAGQKGMQQTTGFVQQTGDQMRNMAQGAAGAMKNAVGMGGSDATTTTTTRP